ncbi:hypothetical protein SDC49_10955 [Lactobacillus sp. R2/2]|nr:hypothetical protein [Lactobacillus sp. R2/2]
MTGEFDDKTMYDFTNHPTINIFEPEEGKLASLITDSYGKRIGKVKIIKQGNTLTIQPHNIQSFDLKIYIAKKKVEEYTDLVGETKLTI